MDSTVLLQGKKFEITLERLCYQLIETYRDFEDTAIIGLQPRGIYAAKRLHLLLEKIIGKNILYGNLDATFHRDDFRRGNQIHIPSAVSIDFPIEDKKIILVDDVLYTGRTIRAGLDALLDFGRPNTVELLTFVDRRYNRQLPIEANYIGL
ncbi:MAG: bifunctional pyr operon transcriptional regulator/uracil phosphoribosyltransferase PyrR, partial [Bacteroidetes bacterium]|nr:bifunctional pyr operon transcriptional regulator/uracil phosphoribosyltransferase PyrR [Bacteroidota bacterium]